MNKKEISWPQAAIVIAFFAAIAVLGVSGRETASFIIVGVGVLGALGIIVGQVAGTKEQQATVIDNTNGKQGRMLDIIEAQSRQLALMVPYTPPTAISAASVDPGALSEVGQAERQDGVQAEAE